jgi:RNA polymerase sigma-70 factor (ECF subfamily)
VPRDDDLVARAKEGDQDAWRELYRAHAGRLVVWLRATGSMDAAVSGEDLAAEAWLTAASRIHDFTGSGSEFAGYLFGVARRVAANHRRRVARRMTTATDPTDLAELSPALVQPQSAVDELAAVRAALADLPQREREVLACLEVVGLDVSSTARALEMSAGAVRVARHRALRRLRQRDSSVLALRGDDAKPQTNRG